MGKKIRKGLIIKIAVVLISALFVVLLIVKISTVSRLVFYVYPSGDTSGETDWANIMAAFEQAKAAGSGNVVELEAGVFYIHKTIQVANFSGTVRGQGKNITVLTDAPGVRFGLSEPPIEPAPAFLSFNLDEGGWPNPNVAANLTFEGFTIHVEGKTEFWSDWSDRFVREDNLLINIYGRYTFNPDGTVKEEPFSVAYVNTTFNDLKLTADIGPGYLNTPGNAVGAISLWGVSYYEAIDGDGDGIPTILWKTNQWLSGKHTISNCEFDGFWYAPIFIKGLKDSTVKIKNINAKNSRVAINMADISNCNIKVSHVVTENCSGFVIRQGEDAIRGASFDPYPKKMPEPSSFLFTHNEINMPQNSKHSGFELWNLAGEVGVQAADVVISNNKIHSPSHLAPFGPIFSYFIDNVVVTNNIITGEGRTAIYVGPYGHSAEGWLLKGNNVQNFNASWGQIYLGPGTSECTVVGKSNKDNVVDNGTNNKLIGVNNMGQRELGQDIKEAIEKKK